MDAVIAKTEERMEKAITSLKNDYAQIRAGRANPAVLDRVQIDYYGVPTPIQQVAAVSIAEARILVIQPWDKQMIQPIEKAIQASDIGINPQNDGNVIRLMFPALTEDRRKEIAKDISKRAEEAKVAVRNIRRDGMDDIKKLKKDNAITEDDQKDGEEKIQKATDKKIKEIDEIASAKEKEVMSV
ncbi:MAG: ribosome recycling factor [Clostridia bacterium]|nr:ribosome recycling factor [Clostridia bacterium]MBR5976928.1 ribosome recycling factor [Clostridia bacterium]MBR5991752.1 ribosome recycling factor [Clostridia bacterium]MBR6479112.1 ribosome recycling factor [Clostridia bacterium]MBR6512578.1 ribosome recycling factor [Clostridia bacterium]